MLQLRQRRLQALIDSLRFYQKKSVERPLLRPQSRQMCHKSVRRSLQRAVIEVPPRPVGVRSPNDGRAGLRLLPQNPDCTIRMVLLLMFVAETSFQAEGISVKVTKREVRHVQWKRTKPLLLEFFEEFESNPPST